MARARKLLIMGPEVLPASTGWLGRMTAFYEATPRIGALGPMVLSADDRILHAGGCFEPPEGSSTWERRLYFRGLPPAHPAANVARPVPEVTAACLMVDADLYEEMGGFAGSYLDEGYEDSDLCVRLVEAGYQNWYLPQVSLYDLKSPVRPAPLRRLIDHYNRWLFTSTWAKRLESIMAEGNRP